jgi:hypothetical protein
VERREASVPRYGTQGASLGAWRAAAKARSRASFTRYGTPHGCRCTRTFLGAPPTPRFGVSEAKLQNPGRRKCVAGRRRAVCMASSAVRDARPHPEERAGRRRSANAKPRTRVSKDEDVRLGLPSCFETHRSARRLRKHLRSRPAAMLLSMRANVRGAFWPNEAKGAFWPNEAKRGIGPSEGQPTGARNDRRRNFIVSDCSLQ